MQVCVLPPIGGPLRPSRGSPRFPYKHPLRSVPKLTRPTGSHRKGRIRYFSRPNHCVSELILFGGQNSSVNLIYCWLQLCGPVHKIKIRFRRPQKNDFPNVFYCVRAFSPRRAILARVTRGAAEMGDAQPRKRGAVAAEDEDEVGRAHFGSGKQGGETRSPASFGCIAFPQQQRPHGPPRPSSKHGGDVDRCQTPPWPPPRQEFIPDYPHTDTGLSVMIIIMPRPGVRERGPV